ncbi:DUF7287 family protein [Halobacterium jilantaiense]|uniref:Uncharacterized protein n=1 Tax=Halobacterium jilantaiense TaxID=355548 RepID=A0A1I0N5B1_9EURY|nr:hypothetical protein [Halobacterium jilantaiense]SEV96266.1 hypothetical protein SAMN04487945_0617 [Halobacterium jilantaiense]
MTASTLPGRRAQTTIDFTVGISVFLVTVAFAFAFVPGIIAPFADAGTADPATANRIADGLATDRLSVAGEEYVLDDERAADFFGDPDAIDRLAVPEYRTVNVTIENATGVVDVGGERAAAGPETPSNADVTTAWRTVTTDDRRLELTVRVW